ncbi:alpha/beta fold hydrolase [Providencia burhodogranariea]|uniref:Carboxylesterase n=1 Tax=Providencia burhodogranariea DSM 19968 TaxID=1141662 RepID=K8WQU9_9GAMM|nr:alpha/beta hydrolase [Providencia burhodogranariea]EKT62993.1 carboxylesterase [Providencia burhodogranariea DSM 19968]
MTLNASITLYYDSFGQPENPAIVLIPGLGGHNISWSEEFCLRLAEAGYFLIRIDNRDSGLSPHFDDSPAINIPELVEHLQRGEQVSIPYSLFDMADDVLALLNQLSIEKAHIIGRSMGGIIAQIVAAKAPHRVLSLCPIMSSTGNPTLPQPESDVMQMLMTSGANPKENLQSYLNAQLSFYRRISSTACPFDEAYYRDYILQALARAYSPEGTKRQLVAVVVTGDIRSHLTAITAPTLVIHGSVDPLFPPAAGQDIADNIANASFDLIEGMGHETPPQLVPIIADKIITHLKNSYSVNL